MGRSFGVGSAGESNSSGLRIYSTGGDPGRDGGRTAGSIEAENRIGGDRPGPDFDSTGGGEEADRMGNLIWRCLIFVFGVAVVVPFLSQERIVLGVASAVLGLSFGFIVSVALFGTSSSKSGAIMRAISLVVRCVGGVLVFVAVVSIVSLVYLWIFVPKQIVGDQQLPVSLNLAKVLSPAMAELMGKAVIAGVVAALLRCLYLFR
jgi:hypothetical protein